MLECLESIIYHFERPNIRVSCICHKLFTIFILEFIKVDYINYLTIKISLIYNLNIIELVNVANTVVVNHVKFYIDFLLSTLFSPSLFIDLVTDRFSK